METIRRISAIVFKALTLAMGVAVATLSCIGSLDEKTAVSLLGIGVASAGIGLAIGTGMKKEKRDKDEAA